MRVFFLSVRCNYRTVVSCLVLFIGLSAKLATYLQLLLRLRMHKTVPAPAPPPPLRAMRLHGVVLHCIQQQHCGYEKEPPENCLNCVWRNFIEHSFICTETLDLV